MAGCGEVELSWDHISANNKRLPFSLFVESPDVKKLIGKEWLSSEIINYCIRMILIDTGNRPEFAVLATEFYTKLMGENQMTGCQSGFSASNVKGWFSKRVNLATVGRTLVPINDTRVENGEHWVLVEIDVVRKAFKYLDPYTREDSGGYTANVQRWFASDTIATRRMARRPNRHPGAKAGRWVQLRDVRVVIHRVHGEGCPIVCSTIFRRRHGTLEVSNG